MQSNKQIKSLLRKQGIKLEPKATQSFSMQDMQKAVIAAFNKGVSVSQEKCLENCPSPDIYSEQSEYTEKRILNHIVLELEKLKVNSQVIDQN